MLKLYGTLAGTSVGSYEIIGRLGAGGMGEVYRARDAELARDVAIKILPEQFSRIPTASLDSGEKPRSWRR